MKTLTFKERSLAQQLAKPPWYSYGTTDVARLLGIKKTDLVALAKSLGDKTGDQVQRSTPIDLATHVPTCLHICRLIFSSLKVWNTLVCSPEKKITIVTKKLALILLKIRSNGVTTSSQNACCAFGGGLAGKRVSASSWYGASWIRWIRCITASHPCPSLLSTQTCSTVHLIGGRRSVHAKELHRRHGRRRG